jgi:hypothetical protein
MNQEYIKKMAHRDGQNLIFLIGLMGGGVQLGHSALRPLIGLLRQPRVIMMMEKLVEWLAGETEVLGKNLPQCRFVHRKPHMLSGREPGRDAAVGSQRLTAWATARPRTSYLRSNFIHIVMAVP